MFPHPQPFANAVSGENQSGLYQDIGTRSLHSVRIGENAGKLATGSYSVFAGYGAGEQNRGGSELCYIGYKSGATGQASSQTTAVGAYSFANGTRANYSTFVGYRAGELVQDGAALVGVGAYSLRENVSGTRTVAVGYRTLERSLEADATTAVGTESCQNLRSGMFVTAMGFQSGRGAFNVSESCYFGAFTGYSNLEGRGNSLFGYKCGELSTGHYNVGIGAFCMQSGGGSCNIAIGSFAGTNSGGSGSVVVGTFAGANNADGTYNVVLGTLAGYSNSGSNSVLVGYSAGSRASGNGLVIIGANAAQSAHSPDSVIVGAGSGSRLQFGGCNVLIGTGANTYTYSNVYGIAIGAEGTLTTNRAISIGNDIQNKRSGSVLVGFNLQSDANYSVVVGNKINIASVIFFKDPLAQGFVEVVAADAATKMGASNIIYTDLLVDPVTAVVYEQARAGILASNIYNSTTDPTPTQPISGTYDLRKIAPKYALASPTFIGVSNESQLSPPPALPLSLEVSSNLTYSITTPSPAFNVHHHDYSAVATLSAPVQVNVTATATSQVTIPISVIKRVAGPDGASGLSNIGQVVYVLEEPPYRGSVAEVVSQDSNVFLNTYEPYLEDSFAPVDRLTYRAVRFITDDVGDRFGIPAPASNVVTIAKPPPPPFVTSNILLSPSQVTYDFSPALYCNVALPRSAPVTLTHLDHNFTLAGYAPFTITSNIVAQNVAYPDSQYPVYIATVSNLAHIAVASNIQEHQAYLGYIESAQSNITALYADLSNIYLPTDPILADLELTSNAGVALLSVAEPPTSGFWHDYVNLAHAWSNAYALTYPSPYVDGFASNVFEFDQSYAPFDIYASNTLAFAQDSTFATSNTLRYGSDPYPVSAEAIAALDSYDPIYVNYFASPRIHLSYSNLTALTLTLDQSAVSHTGTVEYAISDSNITLPVTVASPSYTLSPELTYVVDKPHYGYLDSDAGFAYCNLYPWTAQDTYRLASNTSITPYSVAINHTAEFPAQASWVTGPVFDTDYAVQDTLASYIATPIATCNISYDLTGNPTYFPIAVYDCNIGYFVYTSNFAVTSNETYAPGPDDITILLSVTSNLTFPVYSVNVTESITSNVTPAIDPLNALTLYITETLEVTASNLFAYDTYTTHYASDTLTRTYYNAQTSNYVYSSNFLQITPADEISHYMTTGPTALAITSNIARTSNWGRYEALVPFNRHLYYNPAVPFTGATVIRSNVGPIPSQMVADDYIIPPQWTLHELAQSALPSSNATIYISSNTYSADLAQLLTDIAQDKLDFMPTHVHIADVASGTTQPAPTLAGISLSGGLAYISTGDYAKDRIKFFYSTPAHVSPLFDITLDIFRGPSAYGLDVNLGLTSNYAVSRLGFYLSRPGLSNELARVVFRSIPPAVQLSKTSFNMADASNITVRVTAPGTYSLAYDIYRGPIEDGPVQLPDRIETTTDHANYTIRAFTLDDWPLTTARQDIYLSPSAPVYVGQVFDHIATYGVPASNISLALRTPPPSGFVALRNSAPVQNWTLTDDVAYIPYNPNYLPNEDLDISLVYAGRASQWYPFRLHNHVVRQPRIAVDPTRTAPSARVVPSRTRASLGYLADYATPAPTIAVPYEKQWATSNATVSNVPVAKYAASRPAIFTSTTPINVTIDLADQFNIYSQVASRISWNSNLSADALLHVAKAPAHGIIHLDGVARSTFTLEESRSVVYQNLGSNVYATDTFALALSTTPYDLATDTLAINISLRDLPVITSNNAKFFYYSTYAQAFAAPPMNIAESIGITPVPSAPAYNTHVISSCNLALLAPSSNQYRLLPGAFSNVAQPAFANLAFNHADRPNPLALHPSYSNAFAFPLVGYVNRYANESQIYGSQSNIQSLEYQIDPALPGASNFIDHVIGVDFQVRPHQPFAVGVSNTDFLRTFDFSLVFYGDASSNLKRIRFTRDTVAIGAVIAPVPPNLRISFDDWSSILFVNRDIENGDYASLYMQYNPLSSLLDNAGRNILAGLAIPAIDLNAVRAIRLEIDTQDSDNYFGPSYNIAGGIAVGGNIGTFFDLRNYATTLDFRNFEVSLSTYVIGLEDNDTGDAESHNLIIGKSLTVRGVDNICLGNRFSTSGQNSIILGNDIGQSITAAGVNDVYQSIIIGNLSFQNSIVRDVICIGRENLNDLAQQPAVAVNTFLAQKPVIIGNNIGADLLDFHINVGSAFLKTSVGGDQIYIGVKGEPVGVGFASNVNLDARHMMHVKGCSKADRFIAPANGFMAYAQETLQKGRPVYATGAFYDDLMPIVSSNVSAGPIVGFIDEIWDGGEAIVLHRGIARVWSPAAIGLGSNLYGGAAISLETSSGPALVRSLVRI